MHPKFFILVFEDGLFGCAACAADKKIRATTAAEVPLKAGESFRITRIAHPPRFITLRILIRFSGYAHL
jgi:hypothetical protein